MSYEFKREIDTAEFEPVGGFPRIREPGDYRLRLIGAERGAVGASGKEALLLRFEVAAGEHEGAQHVEACYIWLEDREKRAFAMRLFAQIARSLLGGDGRFASTDALLGLECVATAQRDGEYDGKPSYSLRQWRPAPKRARKEADRPPPPDSGAAAADPLDDEQLPW